MSGCPRSGSGGTSSTGPHSASCVPGTGLPTSGRCFVMATSGSPFFAAKGGRLALQAAAAARGIFVEAMDFMNFTSDAGLLFHTISAMCPFVRGGGHAFRPVQH